MGGVTTPRDSDNEGGQNAYGEALSLQEDGLETKPFGFVVSIRKQGLHRKLHFVGACFRVPGVHCKSYYCYGDLMPSEHDVDSRCDKCFPGEKMVVEPTVVGSPEESFSTSSSESGEKKPLKKARRGRG